MESFFEWLESEGLGEVFFMFFLVGHMFLLMIAGSIQEAIRDKKITNKITKTLSLATMFVFGTFGTLWAALVVFMLIAMLISQ